MRTKCVSSIFGSVHRLCQTIHSCGESTMPTTMGTQGQWAKKSEQNFYLLSFGRSFSISGFLRQDAYHVRILPTQFNHFYSFCSGILAWLFNAIQCTSRVLPFRMFSGHIAPQQQTGNLLYAFEWWTHTHTHFPWFNELFFGTFSRSLRRPHRGQKHHDVMPIHVGAVRRTKCITIHKWN